MSLSDVVPGAPQEQGPRRRSQRAAEKRKQRRRRRTWLTVLVTVVVLGAAGTGAWLGLRPLLASFNTPDDYPGPGTASVTVRIPPGATGVDIAALLQRAGVVKTAKAYLAAAADIPGSANIQPGTYELKERMTGAGAVLALLDPTSRLVKKVTIPEGARVATIFDAIASQTSITPAQLEAAAKDTADLGLPPQARGLEGYLFPATYEVEPGTSATDLLHEMVASTLDQLDQLGVAQNDRHRVLTLASLVQAEGRHPQDLGKIARVLTTRLAKGIPLQLDTTVHYATGRFTVQTTKADLAARSPYNTYLVKGLPPGPICSPGLTAIRAALHPTPGSWLYFVAVNPTTGETKFARTAAEFAKIKAEYDAWQKAHPGQ
ncbi:MAG TPA: endolytic transglycosylase MltG [Kineosporiaceae bacterium]|nr:endolytic transglycosylase MltG [Kineosporiaceae bacterium]